MDGIEKAKVVSSCFSISSGPSITLLLCPDDPATIYGIKQCYFSADQNDHLILVG